MSKRGAGKQLTHDNWNEEDSEPEDQGNFQSAEEEVLKERVIKKARRRVNRTEEQGPTSSPFAAFSGFGSGSLSTTGSGNPFSFLAAPAQESAQKSPQKKTPQKEMSSLAQTRPPIRHASGSGGGGGGTDAPSEYHRQLAALNRSLLAWVQQHVQRSPLCILSPVFRDYETHLRKIEQQFGPTASPSTAAAAEKTPDITSVGAGFSFGSSVAKPASATPPKTGFSFGLSAENSAKTGLASRPAEAGLGVGFKADKPSDVPTPSPVSSVFSFGLKDRKPADSPASSASSTGFSFGLKDGKPATTTAGFSFGFNSGSQGSASSQSTGEATKEESEEPPVPVVSTVQEDDAVYSKRCKLFYKKDGSYVEKGVGMLYLKPCSDGKFQCLIRADTNLGNILLNIKLNKSIPTQRMGKNNVMMACVPNPPLDPKSSDSAPVPLLIRVKTADDADDLLRQLDEHKQ